MASFADPLLGTTFQDKYLIKSMLGRGGMGAVYRAHQKGMDRDVAIKVVLDGSNYSGGDRELIQRFELEMKATAAIDHPNTVQVFEYGHTPDGKLYLVMELLGGWPLSDVITSHAPMSPARVRHIAMQIARALGAAHEEGIIHRDLKPTNVVIIDRYETRDLVKVIDFGLARLRDTPDGNKLTASDLRVGTPMCMAPEYIQTGEVDHRADLYALGVLMYEMASAKTPFEGSPYDVLVAHVQDPAPLPSERNPNAPVPRWLEQIIMKLLEKDPDDRYQTAADVVADLEASIEPRGMSLTVGLALVAGAGIATLAFSAGLGSYALFFAPPPPSSTPEPGLEVALGEPTVVISPFVGIGTDPAAEALAVSLHKEVVLRLGAAEGVAVAPASAVEVHDGQWHFDRPVHGVLEGTVRQTTSGLQVTIRLVSDRGKTLWSEAYDLSIEATPNETAQNIADRVAKRLIR